MAPSWVVGVTTGAYFDRANTEGKIFRAGWKHPKRLAALPALR